MLFNSIEFLLFFPTVFLFYWFVFQRNLRFQNLFLLASSYFFYAWWDYRFLSLILLSTVVDYFVGLKIHDSSDKKLKKSYLLVSIILNLGLLGFFKYFNFFIDSWVDLLNAFGYEHQSINTLNIILPLGISFYTFQTISYSIDIYYGKFTPTRDFISFAVFVSFFPQLVAGPIERASNLLPQILNKRVFKYDRGVQGLRLILYGMFKKVVIADSLAPYVDYIFENHSILGGGVLFLGLIYFTFQIYCDFSGYSDIAIGVAKIIGFNLTKNFNFPLFSKNPVEFWKKWHISLTSWIRDYIYFPMALKTARKKSHYLVQYFNNIYIWIVTGFWHGANWTFIIWGLYWGIVLFVYGQIQGIFTNEKILINKSPNSFIKNNLVKTLKILSMFIITGVSFVIFRSESFSNAIEYLVRMVTNFNIPISHRRGIVFVVILLLFDWLMQNNDGLVLSNQKKIIRWVFYLFLLYLIVADFQIIDKSQFIYFQF